MTMWGTARCRELNTYGVPSARCTVKSGARAPTGSGVTAAGSAGSSARATLASAPMINSEPQSALRMPRAGIGLPHPGIDGQMLYLRDRPEAGTIARLTAAARLERENPARTLSGRSRGFELELPLRASHCIRA